MITLTDQEAKQLRDTLKVAAGVLEQKLSVQPAQPKKPRRNKRQERFDEMYATGKWRKPEGLKKKK
jgi:hypothetical protein